MRVSLGEWLVLRGASWRQFRVEDRRWRRRWWLGLKLGPFSFEMHFRPTHYRRDREPLRRIQKWGTR